MALLADFGTKNGTAKSAIFHIIASTLPIPPRRGDSDFAQTAGHRSILRPERHGPALRLL
jgi:hypothetical protein